MLTLCKRVEQVTGATGARRDEDGFVSAHVQHQDGKGKPIVRVKLGKTSDLEATAAQGDAD